MTNPTIILSTPAEEWYRSLLENNYEEARQRALSLLDEATEDAHGCQVTNTKGPRKVRYRGGQDRAYRFVYYVLNKRVPYEEEVIRHACHNPLCINPDHLRPGRRGDNLEDDRMRHAYGIDYDWL